METVSIKDFAFDPTQVTVKRGTMVTWKNEDGVPHTVTGEPDGVMIDSGSIAPGDEFAYTFEAPGEYLYHCSIHPDMKGKVVVEE